jgi:ABC-type Fe3+-hydroxamate transport system substrate-binding protein
VNWTDALGRTVEIERPPRRIVSLVPSITEALFAFDLGKRIVGVTKFCTEPADGVAGVPKIGGTKNVDVKTVVKLKPDLVIANVEENEKAEVDALVAEGLTVFVTYPRTVIHATTMMRTLADITDKKAAAAPVVAAIEAEAALARAADRDTAPPRVFCPIWRDKWMTIGPDTYMHDFLSSCGLQNVYGDSNKRYPEIELADVAARRPDVVLLPNEPYRFQPRHVKEIAQAIPRIDESRIHIVDGKDVCWYGPRIADALRRIRTTVWGSAPSL